MLKIDSDATLSLRDSVYNTLRDAILKGELEAGTRLMEIHLATQLGVSRTPVREAIRMLEREGLAVTYARRGARVMQMTVKDLEDVLEVRRFLDVLAVKKACENADSETIKNLEKEIDSFKRSIECKDVRKIVECDERFHDIIYSAADNPRLTEIVRSLRQQMYRYRYEYIKEVDVAGQILEEHLRILEGIRKKDKDIVEKAINIHLQNQHDAVKRLITAQNSDIK